MLTMVRVLQCIQLPYKYYTEMLLSAVCVRCCAPNIFIRPLKSVIRGISDLVHVGANCDKLIAQGSQ